MDLRGRSPLRLNVVFWILTASIHQYLDELADSFPGQVVPIDLNTKEAFGPEDILEP
jgi:hypothetical protein